MSYCPAAPFESLRIRGESVTVETEGKILVLPTGNADILPRFNEYSLNSNRLTVSESPFGGLKGSQSPDFSPGTLIINSGDGVYLQDTSGTNTSKILSAGKLKELSLLTIDTQAHSITEEFVICNTSVSNNPTIHGDGSSTTGWSQATGTFTSFTSENGKLKIVGRGTSTPGLKISKSVNLNGKQFLSFKITCDTAKNLCVAIVQTSNETDFIGSRFAITPNVETTFVLPILAPQGTTGQNPSAVTGTINWSNNVTLYIGTYGTDASDVTFYLDDIQSDVARSAYVELSCPDFLADTSLDLQYWTGAAYESTRVVKLDSAYGQVTSNSSKSKFLDGTLLDDVYGTALGRAYFPKGISGQQVTGSSGTMTYSANKGTRNRIGIKIDLPPASTASPNFSKIRLKTVLYYSDINKATNILPDLSGNANHGTMYRVGLVADNKGNPYNAMYFDGINSLVNCGNGNTLNITGPITIVAYIKSTGTSTANQWVVAKGSSAYSLFINPTSDGVLFTMNSGAQTVSKNSSFTDGKYHRIVGIYDGSNICVGVDGVLSTPLPGGTQASNTDNFSIGGKSTASDRQFKGCVSDVRVYTRAWSAEEVTTDYNGQAVSSTGLVAQWKPKTVSHMGATSFNFSDDTSASTGIQNWIKPWLAVLDAPRLDILPDSSGNANHGSMSNVVMAYDSVNNPFGAMSLNGTSSNIDCGNSTTLDLTTAITICSRIYITTNANFGRNSLVQKGSTSYQVGFERNSYNPQIYITIGGTLRSLKSSNNVSTGQWVTLVWKYPTVDNKIAIFLNGTQDCVSSAYTGNIGTDTNKLYIGKNAAEYFPGIVADVRIYGRALTDVEITAYHNNQNISSTGLVASWKPYQPSTDIDFYLHTHRPKSLTYRRDESGSIYEMDLSPGNGLIYHGRVTHCNPTLDTDSDLIPNCLEASIEGSLTKFLQSYGMVI